MNEYLQLCFITVGSYAAHDTCYMLSAPIGKNLNSCDFVLHSLVENSETQKRSTTIYTDTHSLRSWS